MFDMGQCSVFFIQKLARSVFLCVFTTPSYDQSFGVFGFKYTNGYHKHAGVKVQFILNKIFW